MMKDDDEPDLEAHRTNMNQSSNKSTCVTVDFVGDGRKLRGLPVG